MENIIKWAYIFTEYPFKIRFFVCLIISGLVFFISFTAFRYNFIQLIRMIICIFISLSIFIFLLFFQMPTPVNKAVVTLSIQYDPLSIRSMWSNSYLIGCIYEKLPDQEAEEIWKLYDKQGPLTDEETKLKEAFDVYYRRVIGPNRKREVYTEKGNNSEQEINRAEFVKRCNEQKWLEQIGDEIFNDWKIRFEISGDGKTYFLEEEFAKSKVSKYYFDEIFGSRSRLQVIYAFPIDDKKKFKDLLDLNGKSIDFNVRINKSLSLHIASVRLDFEEKHRYEDTEKWDKRLTSKSIFFVYDYDSIDWRSSPEWKRKQSVITKTEDGARSIWSGEYTIPKDYFTK